MHARVSFKLQCHVEQMCCGINLERLAGTTCWIDLLASTTYYMSMNGRQGVDSQSTYIACQTHLITLLIIQNHLVQMPFDTTVILVPSRTTCWSDLLDRPTLSHDLLQEKLARKMAKMHFCYG